MSPFYMGLALQTWTAAGKTIETGQQPLGAVFGTPRVGLVTVEVRLAAQFAAGESLSFGIEAVREDGTPVSLWSFLLDDSLDAGTTNLLELAGVSAQPEAGDLLHANFEYTAGGGPAAPQASIVVQVA
jgi:hypothetical protein